MIITHWGETILSIQGGKGFGPLTNFPWQHCKEVSPGIVCQNISMCVCEENPMPLQGYLGDFLKKDWNVINHITEERLSHKGFKPP